MKNGKIIAVSQKCTQSEAYIRSKIKHSTTFPTIYKTQFSDVVLVIWLGKNICCYILNLVFTAASCRCRFRPVKCNSEHCRSVKCKLWAEME